MICEKAVEGKTGWLLALPEHKSPDTMPTLKAKLRAYLMQDYLILYACQSDIGYLLAIKHHR